MHAVQVAGNACTIEKYVGMWLTVGGPRRSYLDTGCGQVEDEQADVVVIDSGRYENRVGDLRRRNQLLAPVDAPAVAITVRGCRGRGRVGAAGFGQRGGEQAVAVDNIGQMTLPLTCAALPGNRVGPEDQGGVDRHRRDAPPHFCEQQCQFEEAMTAATDCLGQRDSEEVGRREFVPQRRVVAHVAGLEFGEALGCDAVLEELTRDLGDRLLFLGEGEVHCLRRSHLAGGRN